MKNFKNGILQLLVVTLIFAPVVSCDVCPEKTGSSKAISSSKLFYF